MKKLITEYKMEFIIGISSLIVLIVGTITIGLIVSILCVLLINGLYFGKDIYDYFISKKGRKNKMKKIPNKKYSISSNKKTNVITVKNGKAKNKVVSKNKDSEKKKDKDKTKKIDNSKINKSKNNKKSKAERAKIIKRKKIITGIIISLIIGFFMLFVIGIISILGFCYYIVSNAPDFDPEALYTTEPTIIYDKNNNEIDRLGTEQRVVLQYEEIPEVLVNAIIATEDSRFFQHNGVDIKRFSKASVQQLMGIDAGGASTLTMQLSKKTYTSDEKNGIEGIIRKFTDVYIAVFKIEPEYTKEDILTFYANSNFLGGGYGVEQTSLTYFGKSAKDLNLAEAAMIAGLFQAPGKYNPYTNPEATEKRRQTVLKLMLRHGYIDQTEYDIAIQMTVDKIVTENVVEDDVTEYQSFVDQVVYEVKQKTGKDPYIESMKIYTTMDPEKQLYVKNIMDGVTYEWENPDVKAGVAVIDVNTGAVVALGGGRNITTRNSLNYAAQIRRQIGSTAKPLYDYAPGIEYNNWSTYNILVDEPITYSDGTPVNNWDGGFQGFETMRAALTYSRNIPAIKAFQQNDKANILNFVRNLGLHPDLEGNVLHEAHAIGGYAGESAMTMAAAYSAFANGGYYASPYTFRKIEFADGTTYDNTQPRNKVMSEETAFMITSMLIDTAHYACGYFANINNQQYAAKTGTTNFTAEKLEEYNLQWSGAVNDLWTVGYNTDYAIGVWYGYDNFDGIHYNILSSNQHTRLFQAVGQGIFNSNKTFQKPDGVSEVQIEYGCPTPCLPSAYTPDSLKVVELFVAGTEPTTVSDRFDKLPNVSNLKATASGSTVTLNWSAVETPNTLNFEALKNYYRPAFRIDGYLNSYAQGILQQNQAIFGTLGYNVYSKDQSGALTLIGYTKDTNYTIKNQSGDKTYVVKTAYSSFTSNMSDGKSVSIKLGNAPVVDNNTDKDNFIKQLYTNCVGRSATQDDIKNWQSYQSASSIAYGICTTKEAESAYSKKEDDISSIYKAILGRTYTSSEYSIIEPIYQSSRTEVVKYLINSNEFKTYCSNKGLNYTSI